jgi:thimet oligopeptidase
MRFALVLAAALAFVGCARSAATPKGSPVSQKPMPAPDAATLVTVSAQSFLDTCRKDVTTAKARIQTLKTLKGADTQALLTQYDEATAALGNASSRASLTRNVHPDKAVREAAATCEQELDQANTELSLDADVYHALAAVEVKGEDAVTRLWMERALKQFRRSGVDRDEPTRNKVRALNEELVKLGQDFTKNISEDVRRVEVAPSELAGLPEDYVKAHPVQSNGKVVLTTDSPDYVPFMSYAKSTQAREQLWRAYRQRAEKNVEVLSQLISKRHELATLLGYPNWAAYATEMQMTGTETKVSEFVDRLARLSEKRAREDQQALLARKQKDLPKATKVDPWEVEYYEDRVRAERFGFDSQALRPYFEYSRVKQGAMDITSRMFGIVFRRVQNAPVWHPDVESYDVLQGDELLGRVHLDMHPRPDKYKHAAQFDLAVGQTGKLYPEGVLVCNFPKREQPALMLQSQAETLFHEFGHLLHHIFAGRVRWHSVSGIRTEHDFVEVPSMLLQEWMTDPSTLALFAKHHQTGADIPTDLVQKLVASKEFGVGMWTRRQLFLAAISLNYYSRPPGFDSTQVMKELQPKFLPFRTEWAEGTHFQTTFGHLEGYSANYYTYLWSVVIAKDLLTVFQKEGFLNPKPAARLRELILQPGGSRPAAKLVEDFLGRSYDFAAYERYLNGGTATAPVAPKG